MALPDRPLAVVTGGSRGIGRAIALALAARGYRVRATARRPVELAGVEMVACDVTDPGQVTRLFADLERVEVLVNNAGVAGAEASWDAVLATNLTGTWLCCQAALPRLGSRIVNIASVLGLRGVPDQPAYCAAKHGVVGLTRSLALQLAPRGITVNAVCPGWVATDMAEARYAELGIDAAEAAAGTPTGRVTRPEEVAAMVAYLVSPAAANVTGQALVIDGGGLA